MMERFLRVGRVRALHSNMNTQIELALMVMMIMMPRCVAAAAVAVGADDGIDDAMML